MTGGTATDPVDAVIDDARLGHAAVRGGAFTTVAQGARFAIRLISQIAIARLLVPADYGLVAMVGPLLGLVALLGDLGLGQSVVQRERVTHGEVTALFWLGLLANCLLAGIVIALSPLVAWAYDEPRLLAITLSLAALMPISGLATQQAALLTRNMRFGVLAGFDVAPPALGLAAGYVAALHGWGYWSLIVLTAVEAAASTLLICVLSPWRPGRPRYDPGVWSMLRVGGHITGGNFANYLTTTVDNILLGLTHGAAVLGLYDKGYRTVTQPVTQLMAPFARVAMPLFVRLRHDERRYRAAFLRITQMMLLAGWPGILATMLLARPLVLGLLGQQWAAIVPVVAWLCVGALGSSLYASTSWLFVSQHRTAQQLNYVFATSALAIAGFVIGLPWGAPGVAAGAGISFALLAVPLTCWGATRTGPVTAGALAGAIAPLAAAGSVTAAALLLLLRIGGEAEALLQVAAGFALAYGVFLGTLALLPSGRRIVREAWSLRGLLRSDPAG